MKSTLHSDRQTCVIDLLASRKKCRTTQCTAKLFTARIRRMTEGNVFTLSTIAGGTPILLMGGGYLSKIRTWGILGYETGWSTPPTKTGWGTPHQGLDGVPPSVRRQISIASTCYLAGGMLLAFTQEDFLVYLQVNPGFTSAIFLVSFQFMNHENQEFDFS